MYERYSDRVRKVMSLADQEAKRCNQERVAPEHILVGLVKEGTGVGANVLKNLDIDLRRVRSALEGKISIGPDMVSMGKLSLTPFAQQIMKLAVATAERLQHNWIGTEHILIALATEPQGIVAEVFRDLGVTKEKAEKEVLALLSGDSDSVSMAGGAANSSKTPPGPEKVQPPETFYYQRFVEQALKGMTTPGDQWCTRAAQAYATLAHAEATRIQAEAINRLARVFEQFVAKENEDTE